MSSNISDELRKRLDQLEEIIAKQTLSNPIKKQFRSIPNCNILLPDVEMEHLKYLIGAILKISLYRTFTNIKYTEFSCIFNYSDSFTVYEKGPPSPGFEIISGQVVFLGECIRLVKTLQNQNEIFFQLLNDLEDDTEYKRIKMTMAFLPVEGLTAYSFKIDGQTNVYEIKPVFSNQLNYEKLSNFSDVLPFIVSTTQPTLNVLDFDKISKYPSFTKFIYNTIAEGSIQLNALRINVDNFEDWDYEYCKNKIG